MKRKLASALAVVTLAAAASAVAATPASASEGDGPICVTNQPTWLRAAPWSFVLRTLSPGRGFRIHGGMGGGPEGDWYYGHGAEAPWLDGWIPAGNCS
jgi:hypothetical protein